MCVWTVFDESVESGSLPKRLGLEYFEMKLRKGFSSWSL